MTARRSLNLKLALSIVLAFAVSMAVTWFVHDRLAAREADRLINSAFSDVEMEIRSRVNARLVRQAMAVRERLEDGAKTDVLSLRALARELRLTEICIADAKGVIVHSSEPVYLGFDFTKAEGQAAEMMCLIDGQVTEFCQAFQPNSARGSWRKYVGVWRPEGGFVEIGCDGARSRARRSSASPATGTSAGRAASSSRRRPTSSSPTTPVRTARGRSGRGRRPASTGSGARSTASPST